MLLDLRESILTISRKFVSGVYGFFINTEFGVLAVEQLTEDFDPMNPVEVRRWNDAPATNLCVRNRHVTADFWVGIGHADMRKFPARAHIIEAMISVMFMSIIGVVPDEDIVDAGTSIYLSEVENRSISFNLIKDEFMKLNVEILPRQYISVNAVVEKLLRTRIDASWRVIKEARDILAERGFINYAYKFQEPYYMDLFALMMYTLRRNPELSITLGREKFYGIILGNNWSNFNS